MTSDPSLARLELVLSDSPQALPRVVEEFSRRGLPVDELSVEGDRSTRVLRAVTRADAEELRRLRGALEGSSGVQSGLSVRRLGGGAP